MEMSEEELASCLQDMSHDEIVDLQLRLMDLMIDKKAEEGKAVFYDQLSDVLH